MAVRPGNQSFLVGFASRRNVLCFDYWRHVGML